MRGVGCRGGGGWMVGDGRGKGEGGRGKGEGGRGKGEGGRGKGEGAMKGVGDDREKR